MTHHYRVYGFDLRCAFPIGGLLPVSRGCEPAGLPIEITVGNAPQWARAALQLPAEILYSAQERTADSLSNFRLEQFGRAQFFRLLYGDGTQFVADSETRRIWGYCPPTLSAEDLQTYLLGPVMGFVLRRRGLLALHASCFSIAGCSFALCGGAGGGKSTTAAALALRHVAISCEDIAALYERENNFHVAPGYPRINLWPESVACLFGNRSGLPRITPNWDKRFLALDGKAAEFENQERRLAAIYVLDARTDAVAAPWIEKISARDAALLLVQNTYMNYLLDREQRAQEFAAIARLVSRVVVKRVVPSSDPHKITALCELLEIHSRSLSPNTTSSASRSQR